MATQVTPVLRLTETKVPALAHRKPYHCPWCTTDVMPYQPEEDFHGTKMHRVCALEARVAELSVELTELKQLVKRVSYLEGNQPV